jgi:hypothetical protein
LGASGAAAARAGGHAADGGGEVCPARGRGKWEAARVAGWNESRDVGMGMMPGIEGSVAELE